MPLLKERIIKQVFRHWALCMVNVASCAVEIEAQKDGVKFGTDCVNLKLKGEL